MKLSDIPQPALEKLFSTSGIPLQIGPFIISIKTSIRHLAESIRFLYHDFDVEDATRFADYHVSVERPANLRRWIRPQALFCLDGHAPFFPMAAHAAAPLLEWGLNWVVGNHAHQYLVVHSAVLERNGKTLLFAGGPGAGKSTLCSALTFQGWRLLSDELALLSHDGDRVAPIPRPLSIKDASIELIRRVAPHAMFNPVQSVTHEGIIVHVRPPVEAVTRQMEDAPAGVVLFLKFQIDSPLELREVPKARAFLRLAQNIHNYTVLGAAGFEAAARVVESWRFYEFTYGNLDEAKRVLSSL